jgi:Ca-activated chloride channel family protein
VPDGAAIHSFLFEGSSSEPTAQLLPREEARRIYGDIVRKLRDPALLEFAGYSLVRSSVFPVPAGGTQRVRLVYDQVLPAEGGRIDYLLPRSESLEVDVPWEVAVDVKAKSPLATLYSPSHLVETRTLDPRHAVVRTRPEASREPGPFRLSVLLQRDTLAASLFAYPDPKIGGGYFLLLAGLPPYAEAARAALKREVTIVLDRSGSMAGPKMDQVRNAALQVIEGLAEGEAFNVIDYATAVSLFAPKPVVENADTAKQARAYLEALHPIGGTNLHDALVEALRQEPVPGTLPIVLFLTDGLPTVGQTSEAVIRDLVEKVNPHRRRVFTFGVGDEVNAPLLDRIAEASRATSTYVRPGEDVEVAVGRVFQRLYGPVLADGKLLTVDEKGAPVSDVVRERIPEAVPDLFEGDQLVVLGQYRGAGPLRFRLEGNVLGEHRSFAFTLGLESATTRNAFVPRLWAARRIAFLVDQIRQSGAAVPGRPLRPDETPLTDPKYAELVDEIVRLSAEWGILSEYTAFLAREGTELSDWGALEDQVRRELEGKAIAERSGAGAVERAQNLARAKGQERLDYRNQLDTKLARVELAPVQQASDRALFRRGNRWFDGSIVGARAATSVDRTIEFGTPEFERLLDRLVAENRQSLLSVRGEILLHLDGRNVLVRNDE